MWNTNIASDSLVQYSTTSPVPDDAPQIYSAGSVTYHEIQLTGLTPATLYYFTVKSCAKRNRCATVTGKTVATLPICPDPVPPVSGRWTKVDSPNVSSKVLSVQNHLQGVAAVSDYDVWAVGWSTNPEGPQYAKQTLIQHFDGDSWKVIPSPNPTHINTPNGLQPVNYSQLYAVSAISSNDVWAVGLYGNTSYLPSQALILHWDGSRWTIIPSPNPDPALNNLYGVAAVSANDVWAVGLLGGGLTGPVKTFIIHWDGSSWSQVASPNVSGVPNQLSGITAISANDIWAVGFSGNHPLALHWNGISWSSTPLTQGSGLSDEKFTAVSGSAGNDVWAVGYGTGFFSNQQFNTFRHWNGRWWSENVCFASGNGFPPSNFRAFYGVSAAASNDVWAVGLRDAEPLIAHFDGNAWSYIAAPGSQTNSTRLHSVVTLPSGIAWGVGLDVNQSGTANTLIEMYSP